MKILGGEDHVIFGMVLFAVVFLTFVWIGERYADPLTDVEPGVRAKNEDSGGIVTVGAATLAILVLLAGPLISAATQNRPAQIIDDAPLPILSGCEEVVKSQDEGNPVFVGADREKRGSYSCGKFFAELYMASYGRQQQGKELISWNNRVWPREWTPYVIQTVISTQVDGASVEIRQVVIRRPEGQRMVRYWYQVGQSYASSQIKVKLLEVLRILTFQSFESSVIVVSVSGGVTDNFLIMEKELDRHTEQVLNWSQQRIRSGEPR